MSVVDDVLHEIEINSDVLFTWDYERSRPALVKLYEKAKTSQWNASTDLAWDTDVDWEKLAVESRGQTERFQILRTMDGSPLAHWGDKEWLAFSIEMQTAVLSQFLHGEQGALVCTGLITATVPWIDAKYYAATQVMDEARHVEVFARYIEEKTNGAYPISPLLGGLLDDIIADGRWDITYLGMQIMVEGLALAAFGFMHMLTSEPLLKQLLRYVMSDEARHVAFGVLSLKEFYEGLSEPEIRERQEFAYEAAVRLRNRFMVQDVWDRLGVDSKQVVGVPRCEPKPRARDVPDDAVLEDRAELQEARPARRRRRLAATEVRRDGCHPVRGLGRHERGIRRPRRGRRRPRSGLMLDELQMWLEENWDPDLTVGDWWERLGVAGWAAPTLPKDAYGRGLSRSDGVAVQKAIEAFGALGAPAGLGLLLAAPTIATHGTQDQIDLYVRDIVTGQRAWCQLFSEPGAGSDLAGLTTRAVRDGDEWIVNGQKVWTSGGQYADLGMLLARTNPEAPKHQGITWFAFDMQQPGVDIRPLKEMTGHAMFNEVFLSDAVVGAGAVVGDVNNGWAVANTTLMHERAGLGAGGGGSNWMGPLPGQLAGQLSRRAGDYVARADKPRSGRAAARAAGRRRSSSSPRATARTPIL